MQADVKTKNSKKLKVKTLVNSRYTNMGIGQGQEDPNKADKLLI